MVSPRLVIFTEDKTNDKAPEVMLALVKKLLQQLSPGLPTHDPRLKSAAAAAQATMAWRGGHPWRGDWNKRHALVTELASRVEIGDIVLLHHDYDAAPGKPSLMAAQVAGLLSEVARIAPPPWRGAILTITPCYSVESWLYLNENAIDRLPLRHERKKTLRWLKQNFLTTMGYDHVLELKDKCPLGDTHNLTLATQAFPATRAEALSPSWRDTQARLKGSTPLIDLLATINPPLP